MLRSHACASDPHGDRLATVVEDRWHELALEVSSVGAWDWSPKTGAVRWSKGIAALFDMRPEDFDGTYEGYLAILHPDDRPLVLSALEDALAGRRPYEIEHRIVTPSGEERWMACRGRVLRDETGAPERMIGVVWDVTSNKQGEARLAASQREARISEDRFLRIFEGASDGIFLVGSDGRIEGANAAAHDLTGVAAGGLVGRPHAEFFDVSAMGPLTESVQEFRLRRADGKTTLVEASISLLPDGGRQAIVRDVEARRRIESELLLADRMASLGRLAQGVGHEINNPLAYAMLHLELLGPLVPHAATESLGAAREGLSRIAAIVRSLSAFGRGDAETVGGVDVHRALDAAVDLVRNRLVHRGRLERHYRADAPARANEFRMTQVFVNLLVNAIDALADGGDGVVTIRTWDDDAWVVIEVSDTGPGIPAELRARIFDPFFSTKPIGAGSGLGLSISQAIVRGWGGVLELAEDAPGTTFRVFVPRAQPEETERATPAAAPVVPVRRGRVLVVDDEPLIGKVVARVLSEHHVVAVASVDEALEELAHPGFDCILCDVMMPGRDGRHLHEEVRALGGDLADRVVFMSGGVFEPQIQAWLDGLPNPYLAKPFDGATLRRVIRETIAGRS
jgi:PAS domain S-box-containing protein